MSLFRGSLFAGSLYSGALWGGQDEVHPVTPPAPVQPSGGGGSLGSWNLSSNRQSEYRQEQARIRISRMIRDEQDIKDIVSTVTILIGLIE